MTILQKDRIKNGESHDSLLEKMNSPLGFKMLELPYWQN